MASNDRDMSKSDVANLTNTRSVARSYSPIRCLGIGNGTGATAQDDDTVFEEPDLGTIHKVKYLLANILC